MKNHIGQTVKLEVIRESYLSKGKEPKILTEELSHPLKIISISGEQFEENQNTSEQIQNVEVHTVPFVIRW